MRYVPIMLLCFSCAPEVSSVGREEIIEFEKDSGTNIPVDNNIKEVDGGSETSTETEADSGTKEVSHTRPLPNCINLNYTYVDRFGDYGIEMVVKAVDGWLIATGHNAGDIPVRTDADGECFLEIVSWRIREYVNASGRYEPFEDRRGGYITVNSSIMVGGECVEPEDGGIKKYPIHLLSLLRHEMGHAWSCGHKESGVMKETLDSCEILGELEESDIACAQLLTVAEKRY